MLAFQDVGFSYDSDTDVLHDISFSVAPGSCVAVVGANGSGKSTVASLANATYLPSIGKVSVDKDSTADTSELEIKQRVAIVRQDPTTQIVSSRVADEVAFGPHNLGMTGAALRERVDYALRVVGLADKEDADTEGLSGGEQVCLSVASALAMKPRYVVLDEVGAQLDVTMRERVRSQWVAAKCAGTGILLITHEPTDLLWADTVVVLHEGRIGWSGSSDQFFSDAKALTMAEMDTLPFAQALHMTLGNGLTCSQLASDDGTVKIDGLASFAPQHNLTAKLRACFERAHHYEPSHKRTPLLELKGGCACFGKQQVLNSIDLTIHSKEILLVAGRSGSGKSTLARCCAGVQPLSSGRCTLKGRPVHAGEIGLSFQRPHSQLFCDMVSEDIGFGPTNVGMSPERVSQAVQDSCESLSIPSTMLPRHPLTLSGGYQRRVAIAGVVAMQPPVYVFDEPGAGLDAAGKSQIHRLLHSLARQGAGILLVSHDLDEWIPEADRVALLAQGTLVGLYPAHEVVQRPELLRQAGLAVPPELALCSYLEGRTVPAAPAAQPDGKPIVSGQLSALELCDARIKALALILVTVATFMAQGPVAFAALAGILVLVCALSPIHSCDIAHGVRPTLIILIVVLLINSLRFDRTGGLQLGYLSASSIGALRGACAVLRIVLIVGFALVVASSTTPPEGADGVARLLQPLRNLEVAVDDVSMTMALALRFLPVSAQEFAQIKDAQEARALDFSKGNIAERLGHWNAVLVPAIVALFRRSDEVALALNDRAYGAHARIPETKPLGVRDIALLVVSCGVVVIAGSGL